MPAGLTTDSVGMSATTILILVELDDAADCPSGSATVPGGEPREFYGWLGLAAAIKALACPRCDEPRASATASLTEGELA